MITIHSIEDIRIYVEQAKRRGETIGFVPTMGFLHDGHGSLIEHAREDNQQVIVSIFVNPLQFGPNEDFDRYPRDLPKDQAFCEASGVNAIFAPSATEMYGEEGALTQIHVDALGDHLCGASRPGHFDGVATVVAKLFNIIQPDRAYFGKKDFQQLSIVKRLVQDLSIPVEIIGVETVREADGLAKSSRNAYLTPEERTIAPELRKSLKRIQLHVAEGANDLDQLIDAERSHFASLERIRIDYLTCVDLKKLQPIHKLEAGEEGVCAIAAFVGNTRLIDNILLTR